MAGRGRGKTLPAWMTNGDANLSSSIPAISNAPAVGQFSDARESYSADHPPRDAPNMGHFQTPNNNREQYSTGPSFGSRDMFPMQPNVRDSTSHHGQSGHGPAPPQGPPPRAAGRYDMPQVNSSIMPPRPAMQINQDYSAIQGSLGQYTTQPQMNIASGMGAGIAPMMGFQQQMQHTQPIQLQHSQPQQQQLFQQPHLQPTHQFAVPQQQQQLHQPLQNPIMNAGPGMGSGMGLGMGMGMGLQGLQQPPAFSVGRGMPVQLPANVGLGPGGIGMPGAFPQPIGRGLPLALPRGPAPAVTPAAVGDPNNEVSSWSEHEAEDKRKYWYNRVNGTSTYDKPFCLKTPEERSIPPCKWKEYTATDGKKYYSDGKESSWAVPEEFRIWKEKMDAIERKKQAALVPTSSTTRDVNHTVLTTATSQYAETHSAVPSAAVVNLSTAVSVVTNGNINGNNNSNGNGNGSSGQGSANNISTSVSASTTSRKRPVEEEEQRPAVVYATAEEAVEAFKAMLTDRKVLTTMKMKEVQDLCQNDHRFNALKSGGEKKQALAEYQTKTLKLEKEAQKSRARKSRDAFLLMLAENTGIDVRTTWRAAILLLQEDSRYKNVEDPHDREDLFNDFVSELEKKEREDRNKQKDTALKLLSALYEELLGKSLLHRRSSWSDEKDDILKLVRGPEYRALDDIEIKRAFQDFVSKLEKAYREEERLKKQELQKKVDLLSVTLKAAFEKLGFEGVLTPACRWKDWVKRPEVTDNACYQEIELLVNGGGELDKDREGLIVEGTERSERLERLDKNEIIASGMSNSSRNVFEDVVSSIKAGYSKDRRLIKDVLEERKYVITHDSTYEQYIAQLSSAAGVFLVTASTSGTENCSDADIAHVDRTRESGRTTEKIENAGKSDVKLERSTSKGDSDTGKSLQAIMELRPKNALVYFNEIHNEVQAVYDEERKRIKRKEDKFITLLQDFYNRSDHVGTEWEDAKKELGRYSEYENLARADRKRLFTEYMTGLEEMMKVKTKSLHDSMLSEVERSREHSEKKAEMSAERHPEAEKELEKAREVDDRRDGRRHKGDREGEDRDRGRDRDEPVRGRNDLDDREGDRDRDRHKSGREFQSSKRDREDNDEEDGEEDEEGQEDSKKTKKHKKEKSSKDKGDRDRDRDRKHKKHKKDDK